MSGSQNTMTDDGMPTPEEVERENALDSAASDARISPELRLFLSWNGKEYVPLIPETHDAWARLYASSSIRSAYRHVPSIGWCKWSGVVWESCKGDKHDNEIVHEHFQRVQSAYGVLPFIDDDDARRFTIRNLRQAEAVPFAKYTVTAMSVKPGFYASADEFDADMSVLVTPSGVISSERPWPVMPHDSERNVMRCTRGSLNPDLRDGTRWAQFMHEVFPDGEMYDFMRRLLGYIVFGHRREHILPLFHGGGGNGKSVMTDTIVHALGDYASTASPDLLLASRSDRHPTERMVLFGRRYVAASELPEGRRLNEALVKQITGSGRFRARKMYKDEIEFNRTWVPSIDTNHKPHVDARDDAIWQRILLIPFEQNFRGTQREEKGLAGKLQSEPDAVVSWCAVGWKDYRENGGLRVPQVIRDITRGYRTEEDVIGGWIESVRATGRRSCTLAEATALFSIYSNWKLGTREMAAHLRDRGVRVSNGSHNEMTVWL